jgi:hypothetical protein
LADDARTNNPPVATPAPGVSFAYAWSFLWGFMWRSFLTTLPLVFLGPLAFVAIFPFDMLGDPTAMLQPQNLVGYLGKFMLASIVLTVIGLLLMLVAMRWTLNDFQRRGR